MSFQCGTGDQQEFLDQADDSIKEEDLGIVMDHQEYEQYVQSVGGDVVIGTDLSEIVESICKDGGFPESPPDSVSDHLMSPGGCYAGAASGGDFYVQPTNHRRNPDFSVQSMMPDLSKVNYSVPMQMIEDDDYKVTNFN